MLRVIYVPTLHVIYPTGLSLTQSYDPVGRRTLLREAAGAITTYSYQLASVGPFLMIDPQGLSTQLNTQSSLTPRLGHIGNLISPVSYSFSQRFAYAGNGQAFRQRNTRMNQPNEDLNITYDTVGRIFTTGEAGASRRYGYDAAGQLTNDLYVSPALFNLTYSYDPTGNRLTALDGAARTTYAYDAANQLQTEKLGAAITSYSYDPNGNRASQVTGAAITSYTWDEENRLTGIAYPDATRTTYLYSADGLRQRKVDSTGTINYLWDEGRVQQELNENLVEIVRYTQSIWGLDSLVSQYRGGVTSFFGYDLAGNTRQLVDLAGNVTDTYIYETFGVIRTRTGTTINNFEFGGQWGYIHDLFGLSRAGHRIVDSKTGQWLSRDLIGFWGGNANLLIYVGNDPVNGVDPLGTNPLLFTAAAGVIIGGGVGAFSAWHNGGDIWAGAGKGAVIGGIVGLTGGWAGTAVTGWFGAAFGGSAAATVIGGAAGGAAGGAVGDFAGQQTEIALGWRNCYDPYQTAFATTLGGLAGAAAWRPTNAPNQDVVHWGGPINSGDGKWVQLPGPFAKALTGKTLQVSPTAANVPAADLIYPTGPRLIDQFEGVVKGWLGQRMYVGPNTYQ